MSRKFRFPPTKNHSKRFKIFNQPQLMQRKNNSRVFFFQQISLSSASSSNSYSKMNFISHKKPLGIGIKTHQIDIFILQSSNRGKSIWQKPKQQNKNSRERKTTWNRFKMYQFSSEIVPFFPFENPLKFIIFFPSS